MADPEPRRGSLYTARLDPVEGSEQAGARPVLVVSNDLFNAALPLVTIVPLTTLGSRRIYPGEVVIRRSSPGLKVDSLARCQQVRTIARARLGRRIGSVEDSTMDEVGQALRLHLDL